MNDTTAAISVATVTLPNKDDLAEDDYDEESLHDLPVTGKTSTFAYKPKVTPEPPTIIVALFRAIETKVPPLQKMYAEFSQTKVEELEKSLLLLVDDFEKFYGTDLNSEEAVHVNSRLEQYSASEVTTMLRLYLSKLERPLFVPSRRLCKHVSLADTPPTWNLHQNKNNPLRDEIYRICKEMPAEQVCLLAFVLAKLQMLLRKHVTYRLANRKSASFDDAMMGGMSFLAKLFTTNIVQLPEEVIAEMNHRNDSQMDAWTLNLLTQDDLEIKREKSLMMNSVYGYLPFLTDHFQEHLTDYYMVNNSAKTRIISIEESSSENRGEGSLGELTESLIHQKSMKIMDLRNISGRDSPGAHSHQSGNERFERNSVSSSYSSNAEHNKARRISWINTQKITVEASPEMQASNHWNEIRRHSITSLDSRGSRVGVTRNSSSHKAMPKQNIRGRDIEKNTFLLLLSLADFNVWHRLSLKALIGHQNTS